MKRRTNLGLDRFSGFYLWAAFIVMFGLWSPNIFFTLVTVHLIASQQAIAGLMAIAVLVPLVCGQFDLSIGANANLCGIVAVLMQLNWHWPVAAAVLAGVVTGMFVGAINGYLVIILRINSFIATLAVSSILTAVVLILTHGQTPLPVATPLWASLTQHKLLGFQAVIVYLLVLAPLVWWVLDKTPVGRFLYATGGNPEAARLSGVRIDRWSWLSLVASGALSGLAGILYVSYNGPALSFGSSFLLPAFAAVFLGSTQLTPGQFNVWGAMIALFALATGAQGLSVVTGLQWTGEALNGVALIVGVTLAATKTGRPRVPSARRLRRVAVSVGDG